MIKKSFSKVVEIATEIVMGFKSINKNRRPFNLIKDDFSLTNREDIL